MRRSKRQLALPPEQQFLSELATVRAAENGPAIAAVLDRWRNFVHAMEAELSPENPRRPGRPLELGSGTQSKQFMIDLLPHIQQYIASFERGTVFDVLDVGCGTGHGTNLLASLYASSELGYRMRITAYDITDTHHDYIRAVCRYIKHEIRDIFHVDAVFDLVTASHVIEHVEDPLGFCRRLQEMSRGAVFIVAPYAEPPDQLTQGHINSLDAGFVESLGAESVTLMPSAAWGAFFDPPYEMFIARIRGLAT